MSRYSVESPPDSGFAFWYYAAINRFVDDDGNVVHNLSEFFDVWELEDWKRFKEYGILRTRDGDICELYYLDEWRYHSFEDFKAVS